MAVELEREVVEDCLLGVFWIGEGYVLKTDVSDHFCWFLTVYWVFY